MDWVFWLDFTLIESRKTSTFPMITRYPIFIKLKDFFLGFLYVLQFLQHRIIFRTFWNQIFTYLNRRDEKAWWKTGWKSALVKVQQGQCQPAALFLRSTPIKYKICSFKFWKSIFFFQSFDFLRYCWHNNLIQFIYDTIRS